MTAPCIGDVSSSEAPDPLRLIPESYHRLTVGDYHKMIEAEVLGPDDKVELLEGVLVAKTPQSPAHFAIIRVLTGLLARVDILTRPNPQTGQYRAASS